MQAKLCPNNHYYDASVHASCPYCREASPDAMAGSTKPLQPAVKTADADIGLTKALIKERTGVDPVVGWLVCLSGKQKGRDFRMHADHNYIGRGEDMNIVIRDDDTISRSNHAIITYDAKENELILITAKDIRKSTGKQEYVWEAPLNIVFVADKNKGGDGALTSAFISENIYLYCTSENLGTVVRGYFDAQEISKALNLPANKIPVLTQSVGKKK